MASIVSESGSESSLGTHLITSTVSYVEFQTQNLIMVFISPIKYQTPVNTNDPEHSALVRWEAWIFTFVFLNAASFFLLRKLYLLISIPLWYLMPVNKWFFIYLMKIFHNSSTENIFFKTVSSIYISWNPGCKDHPRLIDSCMKNMVRHFS